MSKRGLLSGNLRPLTAAWHAVTFKQPLVGAAYIAAGLGALGYKYAPDLTRGFSRIMSPMLSKEDREELEKPDDKVDAETAKSRKRTWGISLAALGALATIAAHYRPTLPDKGMFSVTPLAGIAKKESMPITTGMPIGVCMDEISRDPSLSPIVKGESLKLLSSFNAPPEQPINGGNLVGQAIATGQSAATGLAVGYLTAQVLGLPNPTSTAILGAVANTLGPREALITSLVFGK